MTIPIVFKQWAIVPSGDLFGSGCWSPRRILAAIHDRQLRNLMRHVRGRV